MNFALKTRNFVSKLNEFCRLIAARAFVGSRSLDYILAEWPHVNNEHVALTGVRTLTTAYHCVRS